MLQFPREVAKRVASSKRSCKACCKFQEKLQSVASRARACCKFRHDAGDMTQATWRRRHALLPPPTPPPHNPPPPTQEKLQSVQSRACCKFQEKLQSVLQVPREVAKRSIKSKSVLQVPTWRRRHDVVSPPPEKMICVLVWEREGLMSILIYGHSNIRYLLVRLRQGGRFLHFPQLPLFPHPATTTPVLGWRHGLAPPALWTLDFCTESCLSVWDDAGRLN